MTSRGNDVTRVPLMNCCLSSTCSFFGLTTTKKKIITVLRLLARMATNYLVVTGVFTAATCTRLGRVQTERAELMVRSTAQDRGTESIRPMEAAQLTVDPPGTLDGIGYLGVRLFLIAAT